MKMWCVVQYGWILHTSFLPLRRMFVLILTNKENWNPMEVTMCMWNMRRKVYCQSVLFCIMLYTLYVFHQNFCCGVTWKQYFFPHLRHLYWAIPEINGTPQQKNFGLLWKKKKKEFPKQKCWLKVDDTPNGRSPRTDWFSLLCVMI